MHSSAYAADAYLLGCMSKSACKESMHVIVHTHANKAHRRVLPYISIHSWIDTGLCVYKEDMHTETHVAVLTQLMLLYLVARIRMCKGSLHVYTH